MNQLDLFEEPETTFFKNFTIYRSSAGSGKTFTLVKEYLKIVLRNPKEYQHILAITFTNKATEEMKERILMNLMEMASGEHTDMYRVIEEEVKHYQQKLNIQDRAQKALTNILHDYSRFSISTIDHFFSQLVRALARELKISLNYEIDVDDDSAMRESLDQLYQQLGRNQELREWIKDFAFSQIENDKGWQLDYTLIDFGKELFKEKFHKGFSRLEKEEVNIEALRELEKKLDVILGRFRKDMKSLAAQALNLIKQHGLKTTDFKGGPSRPVANTFYKILRNDFKLNPTFQKTAGGLADWYTQKSLKREEIKAVAHAGLDSLAAEILAYHQANYREYVSAEQLKKHIYSYGLLDALSEQLKVYRQANNLMLLSHNSFLLKEIISDHEAPFLFEKLGSYYKHVLIDEFQDTSAYQWDILKPLLTNSLDERNHVLLVGDVKQSIYRWRGGDLNLLLQKATSDLQNYQELLEEHQLTVNRRSAREIVAFNNQFFREASQLIGGIEELPANSAMLEDVYQEVEQQVHQELLGGVCIQFFDDNNRQWRSDSLDEMTSVLLEQLEGDAKFSDILILCYKNSEVAEISQHLTQLGLPVSSDQALGLANNWAVRLIISAMYLLKNPGDALARAEMAYLYQRGNNLNQVAYHRIFTESAGLEQGLLGRYLPEALTNRWDEFASGNIYQWTCAVIPLLVHSDQPDPFLARFIEVCLEQNHKGRKTASEFLEWWELNKTDQMVIFPNHQDAITVMTIHKAKGLESPIVMVPWADFELKPRGDSLFWTETLTGPYQKYKLLPLSFTNDLMDSQFAEAFQQELLEGLIEGLNTVYVAFTRAGQRLYVNSKMQSKKSSRTNEPTYLDRLLWQVLKTPEWESYWDLQYNRVTLGDFSEPIKRKQQQTQLALPINKLKIGAFDEKVLFKTAQHRMFTLLDNYHANSIREGIQIHQVLERIKSKSDIPMALDQLLSEGLIKESDKVHLVQRVEELFKLPEFSQFFDTDWQVFSEREIAAEGKYYKPDRVLIGDDRTLVIDFKREKEQDKHRRQLEMYADLLDKMGYQSIEKYLVYVVDTKVLRV